MTSIGKNRFAEAAGQDIHRIGGDFSLMVTGSQSTTFASGRHAKSKEGIRSLAYTLHGPAQQPKGMGRFVVNAKSDLSMTNGRNTTFSNQGNRQDSVGKDMQMTASGSTISTNGKSKRETIGKNLFIDAAAEIHLRIIFEDEDGRYDRDARHAHHHKRQKD